MVIIIMNQYTVTRLRNSVTGKNDRHLIWTFDNRKYQY